MGPGWGIRRKICPNEKSRTARGGEREAMRNAHEASGDAERPSSVWRSEARCDRLRPGGRGVGKRAFGAGLSGQAGSSERRGEPGGRPTSKTQSQSISAHQTHPEQPSPPHTPHQHLHTLHHLTSDRLVHLPGFRLACSLIRFWPVSRSLDQPGSNQAVSAPSTSQPARADINRS